MAVRLVLVLNLDGGGDDAQVRAYGEQVVEAIRERQRAGAEARIEWRPEQLVDVRIEAVP